MAQRTGFLGHVMRTIRQIKSIAAKKSKKTLVTTTEVSVSELINNDKTTELLLSSFGTCVAKEENCVNHSLKK